MSGPARPASGAGEVRYGTAGWVFADWYGSFYPGRAAGEEDDGPGALFSGRPIAAPDPDLGLARRQPLVYYARWFDLVEVNASFYRVPSPETVAGWARQTERREGAPFLFAFKLPQALSHEGAFEAPLLREFAACLAPVQAEGRLAAVLAQFPHSFRWGAAARERLERLRGAYPELPLVVEVRHRGWDAPAARSFLAERGLALANVDQPQDETTLGPAEELTNPELAYVRLHGRNAAAWFDPRAGRDDRYDYLYDEGELAEWAARIDRLAGRARRTLVIANNHFRGKAPANALELRRRREGPLAVPPTLRRSYPRLSALEAR